MTLVDKYRSLIELAKSVGAEHLIVQTEGISLHINGAVPTYADKQALWDEYNRIDSDMRSGDLVLDLRVSRPTEKDAGASYTVVPGDTLSEIASRVDGINWRELWEANRDRIKDPNHIHAGQVLTIPKPMM